MKFKNASAIESIMWQMRLADYPRSRRRAQIDELANGFPPYTEQEATAEGLEVNTNDLTLSKILHDARRQFSVAHLTPDPLYTVTLDYGPVWKRQKWQSSITKNINRIIKGSLPYLEARRSVFANVVRQGPGPMAWDDQDYWAPEAVAIEDIYLPSNTLLTMKNLPFFARYRQYTAREIYRQTHGPKVDPAWNMPLVNQCVEWVDQQSRVLMGTSWSEVWSPEKEQERMKENSGLYASDAVPTINCFDFYFWNDEGKKCGWNRRIILDPWGMPGPGSVAGLVDNASPDSRKLDFGKGQFLYDPGDRVYCDKLSKMIHFQFADASAVAPFRYHSVRSLGFLLYSVCHLQNRMHCRFNEATLESLMQYFRLSNPADMDRPGHIKLINKGVLREGVNFVPRADRWQVDTRLASDAMALNRQIMADNSASFTQDFDLGDDDNSRETATRTNAKVNASAALVSSMLSQSYEYQRFQYQEISRRLCKPNSRDPEVRDFRKRCLKDGVPEEALNVECWDVQPNRVLGGGNKTMQIGIADRLWQMRPVLDPEAQKQVDRIRIVAYSDDYNLSEALVPQKPGVSNTIHDTQQVFGSLMAGAYVEPAPGVNPIEVVETMLKQMEIRIGEIKQTGNVGTAQDTAGLVKAGQYTTAFVEQLKQIPEEQERVREYSDKLGNLMNEVKAFMQRQQQAAAKKNGEGNAEMMVKLQGEIAQLKLKLESKAAQSQQGLQQKEAKFQQKMRQDAEQHQANIAIQGAEAINQIGLSRIKAAQEPVGNGE